MKNFLYWMIRPERILLIVIYLSIALITAITFYFLQDVHLNRFHQGCIIGCFVTIAVILPVNFYLLREHMRKTAIQEALGKMQEKYSRAIASTRDGIFEINFKTNRRYWSPRLKEMIGYGENEVDLDRLALEQIIHPDDIAIREKALNDHFILKTPEFSSVLRWRHKDGHLLWIQSRGKATFDDKGNPLTLAGICTDVTLLKNYEAELEQARQTADRENLAKSEFLAHMSHEIRTPLTAITGAAEILVGRKAQFDEKTNRLLGALNASAQSLRDLLGGILDFSKIESGQMKLEKKAFPVAEVFRDVLDSMTLRAAEKEIGLRFDCKAVENLTMVGDRLRFKQVLTNLVGNAIKFTERGSVALTATREVRHQDSILKIAVQDTGIGIKTGDIDFIFKRYVQADSSISRKYGGTGLGLPIAKQLTLLMGGQIGVSSVFGEGSVFTVEFPLTQVMPETSIDKIERPFGDIPNPAPKSENLSNSRQDGAILIVEDYEGTITIIAEMLDGIGFRHDIARTGLEALKKWHENSYKLILMDIQLPEMDGQTAMTQIRQIEQERNQPRMPIIAMTAHAFSEDKANYLNAGFDAYIPKPISKDDLIDKIFSSLQSVEERNSVVTTLQ